MQEDCRRREPLTGPSTAALHAILTHKSDNGTPLFFIYTAVLKIASSVHGRATGYKQASIDLHAMSTCTRLTLRSWCSFQHVHKMHNIAVAHS